MSLSRFLSFLFVGITVGFILIFVPVYIGVLQDQDQTVFALATLLYLYVVSLSLVFVPIFVGIGLNRGYHALTKRFPRLGRVLLLILLAAVLLYPSLLGLLFTRFVAVSTTILELPSALQTDWQRSRDICHDAATLGDCAGFLSFEFFGTWSDMLGAAFNRLTAAETRAPAVENNDAPAPVEARGTAAVDFPFGQIITVILIGILLDQVIQLYWDGAEGGPRRVKLNLPPQFVRYSLFSVLILLGLYLVIVSMIAIPALEAAPPTLDEVSLETFTAAVELVRDQEPTSGVYDPNTANPLTPLEDYIRATPSVSREIRQWMNDARSSREALVNSYNSFVAEAEGRRITEANMVISAYRNNTVGRIGSREMIEYFDTLVTYYQNEVRSIDSLINTCALNVQSMDGNWVSQVTVLAGEGTTQEKLDYLSSSKRSASPYVVAASCRIDDLPESNIPDRAVLGAYLGAFGELASWLLAPESLSLALLVGMLGTGLLGAAVSPFILAIDQPMPAPAPDAQVGKQPVVEAAQAGTEGAAADAVEGVANPVTAVEPSPRPTTPPPATPSNGTNGQPLLVFEVIIRGVIAAFVVFFAAQTGLIILGAEANQTNGYILLLVCLLAAMFSEIPLKATKNWFKGVLDRLEQNGG